MLPHGPAGHVLQLPDVPVPDPEGEEGDAEAPEEVGRGAGIATVRVAVRDQEDGLGRRGPGVLLSGL